VATKVYLIPEIGFVQVPDDGTREYLIPEGGFFVEDVKDGANTIPIKDYHFNNMRP
jgi:hypothetical protein